MSPREQAVELTRIGVRRAVIVARTGLTAQQVANAVFKARNPGYTAAYAQRSREARQTPCANPGHGWNASKLTERWADRKARRAVEGE